jgi:DNA-binding transcriptional regulator GbsR (MarR family)
VKISAERRYAEEVAVVLGGMGLQPACGKLLGWLLICDPPQQSSAQLADALGLSKASVSTGMRALERIGLARRVAVPGVRGHAYEMRPDALIEISSDAGRAYRQIRELMDRGLTLLADAGRSRGERLRISRDFYAFIEDAVPRLIEQFKQDYEGGRHG